MRILLTNDDGIDAPGLEALRDIAAELSDDVWVVAPDSNHSGAGHSLSLRPSQLPFVIAVGVTGAPKVLHAGLASCHASRCGASSTFS